MAKIVTQNPGSEEIQSPLIAGLSEGLRKLSGILNLKTAVATDAPLNAIVIDNEQSNKNRIYEIEFGKKLWLRNPEPVIKKNGTIIRVTDTPFTIDYIGGSVTFDNNLQDTDNITVSVTYINESSTTIETIQSLLTETSQKSDRYKGYYETVEALASAHSTANNGDFAFVYSPQFAMYSWDHTGSRWKNTQSIEDLSDYYTSSQVDSKLAQKENSIANKGTTSDADNFYLGGRKTWQDVREKARNTPLTGLVTTDPSDVSATDTVVGAIGKLQAQGTINKNKNFISGNGAPATSTAGIVGQRYVNTSNGDWYTCIAANGSTYTWEKGVRKSEFDQKAPKSNPTFTGNVVVPDQAAGTNNGNAANTKFVHSEVATAKAEAISSAVTQSKPKKANVSLSSSWGGTEPDFTQTVSVSGATANSKIDLQPDATVIGRMMEDGVSALYIVNNNGVCTAHAIGAAPTAPITVQITVEEVSV